jgi:hypothetical protein
MELTLELHKMLALAWPGAGCALDSVALTHYQACGSHLNIGPALSLRFLQNYMSTEVGSKGGC